MALLAEIADAWLYTVRARMGLFAHYDPQHSHAHVDETSSIGGGANGIADGVANGVANGDGGSQHQADAAALVDAIEAHHLWVAFLWEVRGIDLWPLSRPRPASASHNVPWRACPSCP